MLLATEATNWLHTILSVHFARIDVKATDLKSFICFYSGFLRNWHYDWALSRTWNRHAIQEEMKQTGKHWSQPRCAYLNYSTFKAIRTCSLRGLSLEKHEITSSSYTHVGFGTSERQTLSRSLLKSVT